MPFLRVVQGGRPGELYEVDADRLLLGRHPSCEVVLENAVISRQHARLIRQGETYVIEDLGSRNGTFVNGTAITGLHPIVNADRIRICDFILEYLDQLPLIDDTLSLAQMRRNDESESRDRRNSGSHETIEQDFQQVELESSSSIITTLNAGSRNYRLDVRPEVKLRAILELSSLFSQTVEMQTVLEKTLECLFHLFPAAELGIILLCESKSAEPVVKAARNAAGKTPEKMPISKAVVRRALDSQEAILSEDIADDTRFRDSESASALEIRSMMCAPLSGYDGQSYGVIQLTTRDLRKIFTQDDLDLFVNVSGQAGLAIENANLHAEMMRRHEVERDLEVATQIQLGFLPNKTPTFDGFEFHHYYQAAQQVGGDYFDYVPLPDGRLAISVGDVSGKGVSAALLMARLCSAVRYHLVAQPTVAEAMTALNHELLESSLGFRFITLLIAVLEPGSQTVSIVNAGHLPPLLHAAQSSDYLQGSCSGLPLGIGGGEQYAEQTCVLEPGDSLLFYTDGITETSDRTGALYGRDLLLKVRPDGEFTATKLVDELLADVNRFGQSDAQQDDRCVVALRRLE